MGFAKGKSMQGNWLVWVICAPFIVLFMLINIAVALAFIDWLARVIVSFLG